MTGGRTAGYEASWEEGTPEGAWHSGASMGGRAAPAWSDSWSAAPAAAVEVSRTPASRTSTIGGGGGGGGSRGRRWVGEEEREESRRAGSLRGSVREDVPLRRGVETEAEKEVRRAERWLERFNDSTNGRYAR